MMARMLVVVVLCVSGSWAVASVQDSEGAAITVYRNPDFFGHRPTDGKDDPYKYPGEPKKPNLRPPNRFDVSYDSSPEFHHGPRDVFHDPGFTPKRGRGPFGHPHLEDEFPSFEKYLENYEERSKPLTDEESLHGDEDIEESNSKDSDEEEEDSSYREEEDEEDSGSYREEGEGDSGPFRGDDEEEEVEESQRQPYEEVDVLDQGISPPKRKSQYSRNPYTEFEFGDIKPRVVDGKIGTREFLKENSPNLEGEAPDLSPPGTSPRPPVKAARQQSASGKVILKYVPRAIKPLFLVSYRRKPHFQKFRVKYRPSAILYGRRRRDNRPVPDDSVYQLNSELDQDYENVLQSHPY